MLTEYRGLTGHRPRRCSAPRCSPTSTDYKVYKNTLARRAAADAGLESEMAESASKGPVAIAFVRPGRRRRRSPRPPRRCADFAKNNP